MKARTIVQKRVTKLSKKLPRLTKTQKKWIFDNCLLHKAYTTGKSAFCLDCGKPIPIELIKRNRVICPNCKTKLKVEKTKKRSDNQKEYAALASIVEEFQVIQNFEIIARYKKGKPVDYSVIGILEYWIDPKGKVTMIGSLCNQSYYGESWGGDWSIRVERFNYGGYYNGNKYKVYPFQYLPGSKFRKEYTKYGINRYIAQSINIIDAINLVPNNSKAETLLKAKQSSILNKMVNYPDKIGRFWPSIKICIRNNYRPKNASDYFDYLELLSFMGKDLHNAKYVCPDNLDEAHQLYLLKKEREMEKQRMIITQEKAALYEKKKAAFMGLNFSNDRINVSFLESVMEVKEEGKALKHCVYQSNYHEKDTLLFSATIDGKKIATAEVCPKKFKIEQVRGWNNKVTKYDEEIITLIKKNMRLIRAKAKSVKKIKQPLEVAC